jgi:hypothetical protein
VHDRGRARRRELHCHSASLSSAFLANYYACQPNDRRMQIGSAAPL